MSVSETECLLLTIWKKKPRLCWKLFPFPVPLGSYFSPRQCRSGGWVTVLCLLRRWWHGQSRYPLPPAHLRRSTWSSIAVQLIYDFTCPCWGKEKLPLPRWASSHGGRGWGWTFSWRESIVFSPTGTDDAQESQATMTEERWRDSDLIRPWAHPICLF